MSNECKRPTVYGRIPFSADPFGLMLGQQSQRMPRLRYVGEGGTGDGGGGDGGKGGDGGDGDTPLDAPGIRALEAERQKRAEARDKLATAQTQLDAFTKLGMTPEQIASLVDANDPNNPERIRKAAERDATKATETRLSNGLRLGAVRAAATAAGFVDVDAVIALTPAETLGALTVDLDGGTVDAAGVAKLLDELGTAKPYLKGTPQDSTPDHRTAGIGAAGSSGTPAEPTPGLGRLRAGYAASGQK